MHQNAKIDPKLNLNLKFDHFSKKNMHLLYKMPKLAQNWIFIQIWQTNFFQYFQPIIQPYFLPISSPYLFTINFTLFFYHYFHLIFANHKFKFKMSLFILVPFSKALSARCAGGRLTLSKKINQYLKTQWFNKSTIFAEIQWFDKIQYFN